MEKKIMQLGEGLQVAVIPHANHEFLMTSKDVATGYDISISCLQDHRQKKSEELIEDVHYIRLKNHSFSEKATSKTCSFQEKVLTGQPNQVLWTKAGIVRLGFFVKSRVAVQFRDWAEHLILDHLEKKEGKVGTAELSGLSIADKLLEIMSDVMLIEQSSLRLRISKKLMELK